MPSLRKPALDERYIIVEGEGEKRTGMCVNYVETSFGRIWVDLKMDDGKEVMRKRLSDVRTQAELKEALAEKNRSNYQKR